MKHEKLFGVLIFFSWSLLLMIVCAVINYNGLYSQDSHEYLRYSHEISNFLKTGDSPGNFFWPVNYPLLGAILSFITGNAIALQLISILSAAWILYLVVIFLLREFPGREWEVAIFVILFLGLSPYFFRYAISSMSDILATAFACTAYYLLYLRVRKGKFRLMIFVLFFAGMAVFTRLALLPLLIPAVLWGSFDLLKNRKYLLLFYSIILSLIPLGIFIFFKAHHSGEIFHHYLVHDWSAMNFFRNSFSTPDGNSTYTIPNLLFVFSCFVHPGFMFPGALFLFIICFRKNQPALLFPIVLIGVSMYLLFIAGIPSRNSRYMVPVLPFYAVACFPAFMTVFAWLYKYGSLKSLVTVGILLIQLVLLIRAFIPFYMFNKVEQQVANAIIDHHPPIVYTFGIDGALKSYGFKGTIVSLWDAPLTSVEGNSMLLFNKSKEEFQWKGKLPMRNFEFILDSARAKKIETLESGWEIYQINEAYPAVDAGLSTVR